MSLISKTKRLNSDMQHTIFSEFSTWKGVVPAYFTADFLGTMTSVDFMEGSNIQEHSTDRYQETPYPQVSEEYFEWISLLESINVAQGKFTMIELGAGYGRWLVSAVKALKQKKDIPYYLIGVEAEPEHFQMMRNHFHNNGLNPDEHICIKAAVTDNDDTALFAVGHAKEWWGQAIMKKSSIIQSEYKNAHVEKIKAISFNTILNPLSYVNLIDIDVQGAEFKALAASADQLDSKVKRVHIGTHSRKIEKNLRKLFKSLGWTNVYDFECQRENATPFGKIKFGDGVQCWINEKLKEPYDLLPRKDSNTIINKNKIFDTCKKLETQIPISSRQIFKEFNLLSGHPWAETAQSTVTNYYPCLYGIVQHEQPCKILEVGTAFGLSAATLLKACSNVELFISIDLGMYGKQMDFLHDNIEFARYHIHNWCCRNGIPLNRARFYRANTQPLREVDDNCEGVDVPRWYQFPDLVRLLESYKFDVIFIDGKHTKDGLLNDLITFWPFLRSDGLIICDDLHDEATYKDVFPWAGDTPCSFESFLKSHSNDINESFIWNFPRVPPGDYTGLRPFGLIRKKTLSYTLPGHSCFEIYDSQDAMEINRARQDHLASIGLDLVNKTVLEVGSGVGWHTAFFEKLCCSILSTDARQQNVEEHLHRHPHRKVEVADLSIPGSHDRFGKFDIVYFYGTLYHLSNPALCIRELSRSCCSLFLLETCVNHKDNGKINIVDEDSNNPNQSFEGIGCRPGRDWVIAELSKYFPYVYSTGYQPNHPEFPLNWPATNPNRLARAVFIASTQQLNLPALSTELLGVQEPVEPALCALTEVVNQDVPIASNKIEDYIEINPENGKIDLPPEITRVWIDVGAYEGKETLGQLREANDLVVIALEPLIKKWEGLKKLHPHMFALPMAVSNLEGFAIFHRTENDVSSSLRSFNPVGLANWKDKNGLDVIEEFTVPTIRLEQIIDLIPLERVEFLKIDAQGHDLDVVKSAGSKLEKIDSIKLEVAVTPVQLYNGGATKEEIISYMTEHGFGLINVESQTNAQEENLTFRTLQRKEKMRLKRKRTDDHTMVKSGFFVKKIKESIKRIPILGSLIWWAYMILKAPSKISELFDTIEELKKHK